MRTGIPLPDISRPCPAQCPSLPDKVWTPCGHRTLNTRGVSVRTTATRTTRQPLITALADDFTGQLCLASLLRDLGLVAGLGATHDEIDVSVVNTQTRDVGRHAAAAVFAARLGRLGIWPKVLWAKRIDSTLRGPIVAELSALAD